MPTYLSPGVYVEEVAAGSRPIEGVGTAVAAFVGLASQGPINEPTLVTNWTQFTQSFGDFTEGTYLAHAVYGYFLNGGGACYVVRIGGDAPAAAARAEIPTVKDAKLAGYRITSLEPGPTGNQVSVEVSDASEPSEDTFKLTVRAPGKPEEVFDNVSVKRGKDNVLTVVKERSKLIAIEEVGGSAVERAPARGRVSLAGAEGAKPMRLTPDDYVGDSADRTGFGGLEAVDEVTMLAVPDLMSLYQKGVIDLEGVQAVQTAMIAHCELMGDRVAIIDAPPGLNAQQVKEWRVDKVGYDSKYATLYWPWIKVMDPLSGSSIMVPPSGHVAGVWARSDDTRGVHKAPANEVVRGVTGLQRALNKEQHDILNPYPVNINVIRDFRPNNRGIRVYGGRCNTSDSDWKYVNVRRLLIFIEASIDRGLQWVVFEPNAEPLWARVRRSITNFLTTLWRNGALEGTKPEEAFFVKCDRTTMTQTDIDSGRLICLVGVAPVKPAEYVIVRIGLWTAHAEE